MEPFKNIDDDSLRTTSTEIERPLLQEKPPMEFARSFLNSLLRPPWSIEGPKSISQALAFVKVTEFVAGKLVATLNPGQRFEFEIDQIAKISLFSLNVSR